MLLWIFCVSQYTYVKEYVLYSNVLLNKGSTADIGVYNTYIGLSSFTYKCYIKDKDKDKGQLISKCPCGVIVWTKIPTKFFPGFLPLKRGQTKKVV